jgi:4-hydroxy-tetrahydrodipicolinate reductase
LTWECLANKNSHNLINIQENSSAVGDGPSPLGLVGAGRTGSVVAQLACEQGLEIAWTARARDGGLDALPDDELRRAVVVIDFSVPGAAERACTRCLQLGLPLVSGTTGWEARRSAWAERFRIEHGTLVYGDNFSIGVHAFMRAAEEAARALGAHDDYEPYVEERHHRAKRDAPSGTARGLIGRILPHLRGKTGFTIAGATAGPIPTDSLSVGVTRAGWIPGTHLLAFDGPHDTVAVSHVARSNRGFAAGALLAARWIGGRKGVWSATEMFDLLTQGGES